LTTLGLTGGVLSQFEVTRQGSNSGDTLVGDMTLIEMKVTFT
jgi:hypothetical protein